MRIPVFHGESSTLFISKRNPLSARFTNDASRFIFAFGILRTWTAVAGGLVFFSFKGSGGEIIFRRVLFSFFRNTVSKASSEIAGDVMNRTHIEAEGIRVGAGAASLVLWHKDQKSNYWKGGGRY